MTDTPEAVRLEFERYFLESRKSKGTNRNPTFERFEDGTYKDDHTQRHWWTWQNALLRRIPELEADYQRLMDKHNALHINALASRRRISELEAERDQLRAELEKVSVLYTQPAAPTPPNADQKGQL